MSTDPSTRVCDAFALGGSSPTLLPGGEGQSWRVRDVVLKPVRDGDDVAALAALLAQVPDGPSFRLARPAVASDGSYVVDGWAATNWVAGRHESGRWDDVLHVADALHTATAVVARPTTPIGDPTSPWAVGDRVAWGEESVGPVPDVVAGAMARLSKYLDADWTGPPPQLVHSDLGGNVLFADAEGLPPAVIDFSPVWRPPPYAAAIAIADAVAWEAAPLTLAVRFAATAPWGDQGLARAVAFRLVAGSLLWPELPARVTAETDGYRPLLTVLGV